MAAAEIVTHTDESSCVAEKEGACSNARVFTMILDFIEARPDVGGAAPPPAADQKGATGAAAGAAATGRRRKAGARGAARKGARADVVRAAGARVGCDTEICVLKSGPFHEHVARRAGAAGLKAVEREVATAFKPPGPRDSLRWLSNVEIDRVLQMWAATEFAALYNHPYSMIDFDRTGGTLARVAVGDILDGRAPQSLGAWGGTVQRPCDTFACIVNTDVSTGPGKHWVAVFGDCRGAAWSVEYFNSGGNPPSRQVTAWMERTAAALRERAGGRAVATAAVTKVRHQHEKSECGLYALYYVRCRC